MSVFEDSRYIETVVYARGDQEVPTLTNRIRHRFNLDNAKLHTWKSSDTLDGVAYKYYEITDFRWAILDANPQYRTEFDIKAGDVIYIPDFTEVVDVVDG